MDIRNRLRWPGQLAATVSGTALCLGLALGPFAAGAQQASVEQAAEISFNIPAQDLNRAILSFANRAGIQVLYDTSALGGLKSQRISGNYTPAAALSRMLAGTGVSYSFTNARNVSLIVPRATVSGAAPGDAIMLKTITLQARDGATEGSGSYTTGQMETAIGLPLSIKETPQSVSIVTRKRLDDQVLNTTADVLRNTPGIQVQEWDGQRSEPFSRGFYLNSFQYDGVALNNLIAMYGEHRSDTLQYDRVEVLRGANGLLTGSGNPSGAVNFVRKHAESDVLTGEVGASVGSWKNHRGTVDLTTPLNADGSVRGRLIFSTNDADSHLDRQSTTSGLFYGIVDVDLGPMTKLSIGAEHQYRDIDNAIWGGVPVLFSNGTRTNFRSSLNTAPRWAYWDTENTNVFASFAHEFDNGWELKLDGIRVHKKGNAKLLYLWGQPDPVTGLGLEPSASQFHHDATQTALSAKLNGSFRIFDRDHEFFSGVTADWLDEDYIHQSGTDLADYGNIFSSNGNYPEPVWAAGRLRVTRIDQVGAYAGTRINVSDQFKVIGGLRYSHIETEVVRTWTGVRTARKERNISPYLGATYDLTPDITAYTSYADVFRVQTERDINDRFLPSVTGSNLEAGIKKTWFDGRLNGALAIFRSMEDNVAVATSEFIPGTNSLAYKTAKGVETKGIEVDISGELASGWNLSLGATLLQSRDANGDDVNTQLPRKMVRLFTSYTLPGDWDNFTIGGGLNWQGTTYLPIESVNGKIRYSQPSYATVGLMANYKINDTFSVQMNVENLFNKRYVHMMEGDEQITFGAPRAASLRISARF